MRFAGLVCLMFAWFNAGPAQERAVPVAVAVPRADPPHVSSQEQVLLLGAPSPRPVLQYRISGPIPARMTPDAAAAPVVQPLPPTVPVPSPPHVTSQHQALFVGAPAPRPVLPYRISAPVPTCATQSAPGPHGATARLEHLLEAAVHLEAAGESQEAQKVRQTVSRERQALQDRLGKGAPRFDAQQILFQLRVVELSRSKLDKLGFEWTVLQGNKPVNLLATHPSSAEQQVLDDNTALLGFLETARKDKLARILAEPTLVTVNGRPVSFNSGGEFPIAQGEANGHDGPVQVGTRIDFLPQITEPDRIHLDLRATITQPVEAHSTNAKDQRPSPVSTLAFTTSVEMKSGQTLVFHAPTRQTGKPGDDSSERIETLVLITSEIVDVPLTAQVP